MKMRKKLDDKDHALWSQTNKDANSESSPDEVLAPGKLWKEL